MPTCILGLLVGKSCRRPFRLDTVKLQASRVQHLPTAMHHKCSILLPCLLTRLRFRHRRLHEAAL